jgi:hypothetical protein
MSNCPNFRKATDDIGQYGTKGKCCGTCLEWYDEGNISACWKFGQDAEFYMTCDFWHGLERRYK